MSSSLVEKLIHRIDWGRAARRSTAEFAGIPDKDRHIIERCLPYTMTGVRRLYSLMEAVRYTVHRQIPGAFAECGVWRGGSVLAMIATLQEMDVDDRDIYLYDTFEGMTEPTEQDVSEFHGRAVDAWQRAKRRREPVWPVEFEPESFNFDSVRDLLLSTRYLKDRLHFVKGDVATTLPTRAPETLALLRLDTDWYESTLHELNHLYPLLSTEGVLIVDDYGHWQGCKLAVDEYFDGTAPFLAPVDYTCRIAIKR